MIYAEVIYVSYDQSELIKLSTGHEIQFGGMGDSYCYDHQSFDCYDDLSNDEWKAIQEA